jgi:hypothetical protein
MKNVKAFLGRNKRQAVLAVALGVTLVATMVSGREKPAEDLVVEPSARSAASQAAPTAADDFDMEKLRRARSAVAVADLFGTDPEPSGAASRGDGLPPEGNAPIEPPLPFRYIGRVIDEGRTSVFLAQGDDQHHSVQAGQTIDQYRVDQVTEDAITFTYLPTRAKKVLQVPPLN